MSFMNLTTDLREPNLKSGNYEGWVIDNNDPKKRQRSRVRIPVLHRDIPDDKLPWSHIKSSGMSQAGAGVGGVNVPDKYAKIDISFDEDDPHNPRYSTSPTSDDVHKDNELLTMDYPNTYGQQDSHGNLTLVNKATGDITTIHKSGSVTNIDGSGNVSVSSVANANVAAAGDISVAAGGNLNLSAGGAVNISGAEIHLNSAAGAAPVIGAARTKPVIESKAGKTSM